MLTKVLVANRGEIAVRLMQTLREQGIASVAIFSEPDRGARHVQLADEAICVGPARATDSYLNMRNIIAAAVLTGATAVHPGFGFLAENADFAELCAQAHLTFVGPDAATIRALGDKAQARETAAALGVPVIPGSAVLPDADAAVAWADKHGYPVLLKAAGGGGGKGIRLATDEATLRKEYRVAQAEALATSGTAALYLERVLLNAKHIEVQVLGDQAGHVWVYPERDCSLQRARQKVLEMSPSLTMTSERRAHLQEMARTIAKGTHYLNAGTLEFLEDEDGTCYFMEMNTRIQVEHPVSEMVTHTDLLVLQLAIAAGDDLPGGDRLLEPDGVALECRINAEDPRRQFAPMAGHVPAISWPLGGMGTRIDRGLAAGDTISPYYDSMVAKLITHGEDTSQAFARMSRMLTELHVSGIPTNRALQAALVADDVVRAGRATTTYLGETWLPQWLASQKES